ncbi:MAG: DUF1329 domain-containing protein [Gammaproteobacteria bacterium]|nr:DUF1329 domain-containing protein [Gammaproteobacteria bacterium]
MKKLFIGTIAGLAATVAGAEISEDVIQNSFNPYANSTPTAEGYEPGVVINADNVDQYEEIFDEFLFRYVKNGWYEITTRPTFSISIHENRVQATREHADGVSLSPEGTLVNYIAGRPFPQKPDINDPEAGLKLMWNFQRGFNAGDSETIKPFYWTFRNAKTGKTERQIRFHWRFLNWQHRTVFDPKPSIEPNPGGIFRSIYGTVLEPFDLANTQLLIQRYEDDLRRDDGWIYVGFQRRVRRLAVGQITDAFLGSDAMIEDFEGYNGRISDYTWEYKGETNFLSPFIKRDEATLSKDPEKDPDGFQFIEMGGRGNCFPLVKWQLRKGYIVEGRPKDKNHPLSKRVFYFDAETMTIPIIQVFDKKGDPWKWFPICKTDPKTHLPANRDSGVAVEDCAVFFDEQADHCTTLQFKSVMNKEDTDPLLFNVQNLRKTGR